jgi:nucleotide-binding universal stress UspA family protein
VTVGPGREGFVAGDPSPFVHYLLAADSVHTAAAGCDYLADRLAGDDRVTVLAVAEPDAPARDPGDAVNVARGRLLATGATVAVEEREGDPATAVPAAVDDLEPDVVVVAAHAGAPGASGVGSTTRTLLAAADVPVVVVPLSGLSGGGGGEN